jgi:hypothetical protein
MSGLTIKELLGIDFEDKGLAETIDSVTKNQCEMESVQDAVGRAIFLDGGLLEAAICNCDSKLMIEQVAYDSDRVMNMLCYYASNTESFMERL